ncbi:MAG: hypothetical protein EAZ55_06165 [Cytophagales bacterium]|nr:MAG: hypothetical protein EAZ55_06165 [Cytophagales bacterium]
MKFYLMTILCVMSLHLNSYAQNTFKKFSLTITLPTHWKEEVKANNQFYAYSTQNNSTIDIRSLGNITSQELYIAIVELVKEKKIAPEEVKVPEKYANAMGMEMYYFYGNKKPYKMDNGDMLDGWWSIYTLEKDEQKYLIITQEYSLQGEIKGLEDFKNIIDQIK